jgi:hypothetical protein
MRGGIVVIGAVLIIIGLLGFWFGSSIMQSIDQYGFFGDLAKSMFLDVNQRYQFGRLIYYGGIAFIVMGFITFVCGFIVSVPKGGEK